MDTDEESNKDEVACPGCGSANVEAVANWHHFLCAYIGPAYDFPSEKGVHHCPKCSGALENDAEDWEVVGHSLRCLSCGRDFIDNRHDS